MCLDHCKKQIYSKVIKQQISEADFEKCNCLNFWNKKLLFLLFLNYILFRLYIIETIRFHSFYIYSAASIRNFLFFYFNDLSIGWLVGWLGLRHINLCSQFYFKQFSLAWVYSLIVKNISISNYSVYSNSSNSANSV